MTISFHVVTEAPPFTVVADLAIVKGKTPAADRTWLSFPDGTAHRAAVHVIHDLPHLVIESVFGLPDGLWGSLAAGDCAPVTRAPISVAPQQPKQSPQNNSATPGDGRKGWHCGGWC